MDDGQRYEASVSKDARAIPGAEAVTGGTYRRTINLPNRTGVVALRPAGTPRPPTSTASFSSRTCGTSRPRSSAAGDSSTWTPTRRLTGGPFLPTDAGVRHGLAALGTGSDPASATRQAGSWRPWRSYALQHLWAITERESS